VVFVADESCDHAVVRALRKAGHEVEAISEVAPRTDDDTVLKRAAGKNVVLLTEDHDFGRLVYAAGRAATGVILLRYPAVLRRQIAESVCNLVQQHGKELAGRFVVVEPGRIRMSPLPRG
jgi:predicted nuclease of predicted toxin-antitoxin system